MAPHIQSDEADAIARRLIGDLHTPKPIIFWTDILVCAVVGWTGFALAVLAEPYSGWMALSFVLAVIGLYRGVAFTHELSHIRPRALRGFETTWNLLFGVPLLLPSFAYIGVHPSHHNLATYGTKDDPEYLPFASSRGLMIGFGIQSALLLPLLLLLRFLVLAPIGLAAPPFHRWLETRASSFAMNPAYRREVSSDMARKMRVWEVVTLGMWGVAIALAVDAGLLWRAGATWIAVLLAISTLNTLRVLGAHEYETDGQPRNRFEQLRDSIDTPGGPWTEIWAPVGLRYHALHHYFPGVPYHNLGIAYRRLVAGLPRDAGYHESMSPSLRSSLAHLYSHARRSRSA